MRFQSARSQVQDGHADFVYLQKTIEKLEIEQKIRNTLIQKAIDKMVETNRDRIELETEKSHKRKYENNFGNVYTVPVEVYADKTYREKLNRANTSSQAESIVRNYYKYRGIGKDLSKKKHWWQ